MSFKSRVAVGTALLAAPGGSREVAGFVIGVTDSGAGFWLRGAELHGVWLVDEDPHRGFVNIGALTGRIGAWEAYSGDPWGGLYLAEDEVDCSEIAQHAQALAQAARTLYDEVRAEGGRGAVGDHCAAMDALIAASPALDPPRPDGVWTVRGSRSLSLSRWTGWRPDAMWDESSCSFDPRRRWRGTTAWVDGRSTVRWSVARSGDRVRGSVAGWLDQHGRAVVDLRFDVPVCEIDRGPAVQLHHAPR